MKYYKFNHNNDFWAKYLVKIDTRFSYLNTFLKYIVT
jgi:hypothetical protein